MSPSGTVNLNVIDISHYQGSSIDWNSVAANVDAVYIKATEGSTYTDPMAAINAASAQSVIIPYGFYTYFWPYNDLSQAVAEADHFYNFIKNYHYSCIPVLDVEITNGVSGPQIVANIQAFASEFKKLSGQDIMIYANPYFVNTYLDSSLSGFRFWIAHYTSNNAPMDTNVWHQWDMWQYTSSLSIPGIIGGVDGDRATSNIFLSPSAGVSYEGHVQNIGWQNFVSNGSLCGTTGEGLRMEALKMRLDNMPSGMHINYAAHVQSVGWQGWVSDGTLAGTTGRGLRIEALQIKLSGTDSDKYSVEYQAHVQNIGWQNWVYDGQTAGTTGQALRIEAIRVKIVPKIPSVTYQSHVQNIGWQDPVTQGDVSGTTGRGLHMEALKVNLDNAPAGLTIAYKAHVQNIGWQDWNSDGMIAGTTGQGLQMEALQIKLQGTNADLYSVQYRTHVQNIGWQDWVGDGAMAVTTGRGLSIEGIQIRIVPRNG